MVITITGTNSFHRSLELSTIVESYIADSTDMGLERLDGEIISIQRFSDAINSLPFLSPTKLIIIRSPSANKTLCESIMMAIPTIDSAIQLIIHEPTIDKRSVFYKFLKQHTDFREFNDLDTAKLGQWIGGYVEQNAGSITLVDAKYLIDRIGASQQLLYQEINKLLVYNPAITRATIDALTEQAPQGTIFDLVAASFGGNVSKVWKIYLNQRRMKVEPQQILAMLTWQLHIIALLKTADNQTIDDIGQEAKIKPYTLRKSESIARSISLDKLKRIIKKGLQLDIDMKSLSIDADDAVMNLLLYMAQ
ncbi:MAG: hypothetical protein NVSMB46_00640 [Candidatus Saccharimonadales bacterium]